MGGTWRKCLATDAARAAGKRVGSEGSGWIEYKTQEPDNNRENDSEIKTYCYNEKTGRRHHEPADFPQDAVRGCAEAPK